MATKDHDARFLARWARLKAAAQRERADPPAPSAIDATTPIDLEARSSAESVASVDPGAPAPSPVGAATDAGTESPPLTLADVAQLTRDSDFSRFVAPGVQTDVKNAALKKLFSDPHFNVMDGLDVYIDDYNKSDPLPAAMLLKMAQASFLGLVKQKAEAMIEDAQASFTQGSIEVEPLCSASDTPADAPQADTVASNEDADLQLQPNDAAGRADVEPCPGEDGGREH